MAVQSRRYVALPMVLPPMESPRFPVAIALNSRSRGASFQNVCKLNIERTAGVCGRRTSLFRVPALCNRTNRFTGDDHARNNKAKAGSTVPSSNYVVPLDKSCITRPLVEILRDLNKRISDKIIVKQSDSAHDAFIPWYHANRMLSFYAPGWCGEIRDVIFSDSGSVTVVYRVTVRGSDGEAHRESTGTVSSSSNDQNIDPVAAAEEIAFCKACARFGLGLYLYHEDKLP